MTPRQKCAHCGKVTDFHDDFCTLCWSHRTKGKVLTDAQTADCQAKFASASEKKRWLAEFGRWQNKLLAPTIMMLLWCVYWAFVTLPLYLKFDFGLLELVTALLCAAGFAVGGFMVGGTKALHVACSLLILASLACIVHIGDYLLGTFDDIASHGEGMLWSSVRIVLCGTILFSSFKVLRIKRPAAA